MLAVAIATVFRANLIYRRTFAAFKILADKQKLSSIGKIFAASLIAIITGKSTIITNFLNPVQED